MKFQLFLFALLLLSFIAYFKAKKSFNTLKWFTIFFSILTLPCYFLLKEIDLSSTPILLQTTNFTKEELNVYSILFYKDFKPMVFYNNKVKAGQSTKTILDIEGSYELWIVATDKNSNNKFVEKADGPIFEDKQILIKGDNIPKYRDDIARKLIRRFRLKKGIEYSLLILNILLIFILILKVKARPAAIV